MSDRRRWKEQEIDLLVDFVEVNYEYLTCSFNANKSKKDQDDKWQECADGINALAAGSPFKWEQVKKKWQDLKSQAKKVVTAYDKQSRATGGGRNTAPMPTPLQERICRIIGSIHTNGIPDTEGLDTDGINCSLALIPMIPPSTSTGTSQLASPVLAGVSSLKIPSRSPVDDTTPSKRPKMTKREARDEEILSVERNLVETVNELKAEIHNLSSTATAILFEQQRANTLREEKMKMVAVAGCCGCRKNHSADRESSSTTQQPAVLQELFGLQYNN